VMNTPGARIRSVRFKVPNEPYSIELVEFSGIERKPQLSNHNDPGSSFLNMGYLDSAKILAALRDAHAVPASPLGLPAPGKRGSPWVRDPDGFLFEIMRGGWDDQKKPKEGLRSAYRGHFGITMETIQQSMAFYHDLLGFSIQLGFGATSAASQDNGTPCTSGKGLCVKAGEFRPVGGIADGIGFPGGGNFSGSEGYCAGARCEFFEFKDAPRKAFRPRMQDPGAAYLSVWTSDFDGLVSRMKAAGTDVVSTGGAPVLVHGTRQLLVRDPGGFLVLLMEKK